MNAPPLPPRASLVVPSLPGDGADDAPSQRHRTIWISGLRLGTPGCKGAQVAYAPGKHDEFARDFFGHAFGGIERASDAAGAGQ